METNIIQCQVGFVFSFSTRSASHICTERNILKTYLQSRCSARGDWIPRDCFWVSYSDEIRFPWRIRQGILRELQCINNETQKLNNEKCMLSNAWTLGSFQSTPLHGNTHISLHIPLYDGRGQAEGRQLTTGILQP